MKNIRRAPRWSHVRSSQFSSWARVKSTKGMLTVTSMIFHCLIKKVFIFWLPESSLFFPCEAWYSNKLYQFVKYKHLLCYYFENLTIFFFRVFIHHGDIPHWRCKKEKKKKETFCRDRGKKKVVDIIKVNKWNGLHPFHT